MSRTRATTTRSDGSLPGGAALRKTATSALTVALITVASVLSGRSPADCQQPDPRNLRPVPQAEVPSSTIYLTRGRQALDQGNTQAALGNFREFVRLRPNDADGQFWLALALDRAGAAKDALWAYSRCLDLATRQDMDSAELRVNIGNILLRGNQLDDAIFNYRRAIEISPGLASAHFYLGRALLEKGAPEEAFAALSKSADLGLKDRSLPLFRGLSLKALGKNEDARAQLELFIKAAKQDARSPAAATMEAERALLELAPASPLPSPPGDAPPPPSQSPPEP